MKYSTVLALAAFAAGASAQVTRADFPACALTCLQQAIASETDCTVDDVSCSCEPANNSKVRAVATPCVLSSCQGDDITKTLQVSEEICAPGNNPGGSGGESQTSAAEETTTATETASETATETASETATETASETVSESATETATSTETADDAEETSTAAPVDPAPTANTTAPTQPPPTFTGAAGKVGATLGSVAMAALAALAL